MHEILYRILIQPSIAAATSKSVKIKYKNKTLIETNAPNSIWIFDRTFTSLQNLNENKYMKYRGLMYAYRD